MSKQEVLVSLRVEVDPPAWHGRHGDVEGYERYLNTWASEFNAFLHDHRSRDRATLSVVRQYEDRCSFCARTWEVADDGCPVCCGKAIAEWEAEARAEWDAESAVRWDAEQGRWISEGAEAKP